MFDWPQLLLSQYGDNLAGEFGKIPNPYVNGYSTEISTTVNDPRINNGQWTNLPTLVQGLPDPNHRMMMNQLTPEQYEAVIQRAMQRGVPRGYDSRIGAEVMAGWRSRAKDGLFD